MKNSRLPVATPKKNEAQIERTFERFSRGQRLEHSLLIVTIAIQLLTGLPQKYRLATWSQHILATPERLALIRDIHHITAVVLSLEVVYHLLRAVVSLARRKLSPVMLPTWQDMRDAWQMIKYLLFLSDQKPAFGKFNFEQKFTYWFLFFGIGILVISGFILWQPEFFTRFLPGEMIPASKLAHSTEAIVAAIFILIWHFYHVHIERLNLSIFTGRINEADTKQYHLAEYQRLTGESSEGSEPGEVV